MTRYDVVVLGLGTAGAAAAALCAARGLTVLGLDARPLDQAGARWVNGVPRWAFEAAGLPAPAEPELRGEGHRFHIVAGWGPERVTVQDHGVMEVDMRHLVARLQGLARDAGADLRGGVRARGREGDVLQTDDGPIAARVIVDASGLAGPNLLGRPRPVAAELCVAAQEVRAVRDAQAAAAFLAAHGVAEGETLCFTGVEGGYSIVNVRVEGDEVGVLTGSIPALGFPSGRALLDRFLEDQPWVGDRVFGGARAIPLSAPATRLAAGNVALLGDAASQVFAMHGSGIAAGMLAARLLADTLADGGTPDDYNWKWQRQWGGLLAGAQDFARFSRDLTTDDVRTLIRSGLMNEAMVRDGLAQRPPSLDPRTLPTLALGLARAPRLGARVLPVAARMEALRALYAAYPRDPARVPAWERWLGRVRGR